jgi:hypothetical protein
MVRLEQPKNETEMPWQLLGRGTNNEGYHAIAMLSCDALLLTLESEFGFPGVKLEALVEGDVLSDDGGSGASSWATVQTAVVW